MRILSLLALCIALILPAIGRADESEVRTSYNGKLLTFNGDSFDCTYRVAGVDHDYSLTVWRSNDAKWYLDGLEIRPSEIKLPARCILTYKGPNGGSALVEVHALTRPSDKAVKAGCDCELTGVCTCKVCTCGFVSAQQPTPPAPTPANTITFTRPLAAGTYALGSGLLESGVVITLPSAVLPGTYAVSQVSQAKAKVVTYPNVTKYYSTGEPITFVWDATLGAYRPEACWDSVYDPVRGVWYTPARAAQGACATGNCGTSFGSFQGAGGCASGQCGSSAAAGRAGFFGRRR
jgi:hypothetical protein